LGGNSIFVTFFFSSLHSQVQPSLESQGQLVEAFQLSD